MYVHNIYIICSYIFLNYLFLKSKCVIKDYFQIFPIQLFMQVLQIKFQFNNLQYVQYILFNILFIKKSPNQCHL